MMDMQNSSSPHRRPFRMSGVFALVLILGLAPVLSGCATAVVGAGAAVGVAAAEERTIGTVADDTKMAAQIRLEILDKGQDYAIKVGIEVFEGRVLLTGAVPTEQMRADAVRIAWTIKGVKDVINEIQISSSGLVDTARDVWITTQLTSKITFDEHVHAINYAVETVNGIIYLIGIAQNQAELDRVIAYARELNYVKKVISHVRLKKRGLMPDRSALMAELEAAGRCEDDEIDIAAVALTLAALANPDASREPYRRHLTKVADDVAAYVSGHRGPVPLELRHEALVQVIHKRLGYVGTEDVFDDIEAANIMRVIDRRGGLPVAIGVLYLHAAKHMGWPAAGVDFPGRFLLRLDADDGRLIFDGFEGGGALAAPDLRRMLKSMAGPNAELDPMHYRRAGPRAVLLRLQNNIKIRHLDARRPGAALNVLETMVAIAPEDPALWREVGVLHARLDQIPAAVAALEECLRRGGPDEARYQTSALLQELRGRLH